MVAYESLPKRDRKDKHLAVAEYLLQGWGSDEDEIVEVVASHYLEAFRLAPQAPDAEVVKAKAREMIIRAGERAAALAASDGAQRYFEQALELTDETQGKAALQERAGQMAAFGGRTDDARAHFEDGDLDARVDRRDARERPGVRAPRRDRLSGGAAGARDRPHGEGLLPPRRRGARRGSRHARRPARTAPCLHRCPRPRRVTHRVRPRPRREVPAARATVGSSEHQGGPAGVPRPCRGGHGSPRACLAGGPGQRPLGFSASRVQQPRRFLLGCRPLRGSSGPDGERG